MKKFITIKEASQILEVSRITLRNWDKSGKLTALRHPFNNYRIYKIEDIDKVIEMIGNSETVVRRKKEEVRRLSIQHLDN